MPKLNGKIALVTGASSGIGEATALRLATAGYKVYGTSRRGAQAGQASFEMLPLDVTSDASVAAAVAKVVQREGRIDLLVNNAGFGVSPAGAEESSIEQAQAIFDTNFFGIVRMTRSVVPHMRRHGRGRIINIGLGARLPEILRGWILAALFLTMALPLFFSLEAGLFAVMLFEPFRGLVRRGQYLIVDYSQFDPIHILTPLVTLTPHWLPGWSSRSSESWPRGWSAPGGSRFRCWSASSDQKLRCAARRSPWSGR